MKGLELSKLKQSQNFQDNPTFILVCGCFFDTYIIYVHITKFLSVNNCLHSSAHQHFEGCQLSLMSFSYSSCLRFLQHNTPYKRHLIKFLLNPIMFIGQQNSFLFSANKNFHHCIFTFASFQNWCLLSFLLNKSLPFLSFS